MLQQRVVGVLRSQGALADDLVAGRYQVMARVGSGGMGEVYRAKDTVLGRTVALKMLPASMASQRGFVDRFKAEAQAAARVSHPNVVQVHDWGETQGTYFMVMEYVRGKNLRQVLAANERLSPPQAVEVVRQILAALGAAHRTGMVHRDIKPENVIIDADGNAKVTDFGIAKVIEDAGLTGGLLGTVAYAAPEQARGEAVDGRTDLYSTGCLFYELLTGNRPFEGDPVFVLNQHLNERVPPPSRESPEVSHELDRIVEKATHPDPTERYATASAMREDLASAQPGSAELYGLAAELTSEVPVGATQTVVNVAVRRKKFGWLKWLALLVVTGLIASAAYFFWPHEVPQVVGDKQQDAQTSLEDAGFLVVLRSVFSERDPGLVIETEPPSGSRVRRGSEVILVVSKGPELTDVPVLTGSTIEQATAALETAGLVVGTVKEQSAKAVKGMVLEQDPAPGRARRGDPVNLVVSTGPKMVDVPVVTNKQVADAKSALQSVGLSFIIEEQFSDGPVGTVLSQDPSGGKKVEEGSSVKLVVSKGTQPFPMPDVKNKACSDAMSTLKSQGLAVSVRNSKGEATTTCGTNRVLEQDPLPGATVKKGDQVTLYV